jgi:hypothetical protein
MIKLSLDLGGLEGEFSYDTLRIFSNCLFCVLLSSRIFAVWQHGNIAAWQHSNIVVWCYGASVQWYDGKEMDQVLE